MLMLHQAIFAKTIAGQRLEAVSAGEFIPRGTRIRAVRYENAQLTVVKA